MNSPNDEIVVAWFCGTQEAADDVAVWCSARRNGEWSAPTNVADQPDVPLWNPVLFLNSDGIIFLYYKVGRHPRNWQTFYIASEDAGKTWGASEILVYGDGGG